MKPPIEKGARVVVGGNLQPYAAAYVADTLYIPKESRWAIILEWPDAPGGPSTSRVYDHDENRVWFRYGSVS